MATFPTSITISPATRTNPDDGRATQVAGNQVVGINIRDDVIYRPVLVFEDLDSSEVSTLFAFYDANKDVSFEIDIAGTTYDMIFAGAPKDVAYRGDRVSYAVAMQGKAQ